MAIVMSDWRSKLESTLADDALEGVLPLGTRRAALDEEDLLPSPPPPLSRDQAADVISCELEEVKRAFKLRREQGKPAEPGAQGTIIHVNPFDESKLAKYEAEMLKRFGDKVATPQGAIRVSRVREQHRANVVEFSRGNELFDKRAFAAALAEYEVAVQIPELKFFAFINRGNAFKASKSFSEAASCYENALDASSLVSAQGRLLHSCALNNLGALCLEKGSFDQALQHLAASLALNPKCYLALKNRAHLHMAQSEVNVDTEPHALVAAQQEMALSYYARAMDHDWNLPTGFHAGQVFMRLETRMTRSPGDIVNARASQRNEVYHFGTNLTHVKSEHV